MPKYEWSIAGAWALCVLGCLVFWAAFITGLWALVGVIYG